MSIQKRALSSPKARRARATTRGAQAALRLFGGGAYNGGRSDRAALKNWRPELGGPNSDTLPDLETLRARSADLERNAPIATGVIATNVTSTVGTGIVPHARIDREFLGLTDEQGDAWETDVERIFDWWCMSTACDLASRMDFYSMQGLALRSSLVRGDLFAVKRFVDRAGDLLSTRLQLIEADRVSNPIGQPERDGMLGGIEYDQFTGRQVRIHINDAHPGEGSARIKWTAEDVYGTSTGGRRVLHIMDFTRIDQMRGVPYLAPVMEALKQLDRYTEAEIMAAVVNAFLSVFIKTTGENDDDILPDMGDENTLAAARALPGAERDVRLGPGAIVGLEPGEEPWQTSVSRPNPQFDPFVQAILRQVGVALEVPFELLVKHFTSSYSASRAAMLEAWRSTSRRRSWLVTAFCQPVWEWVIEEAVARGILDAPGFFDNPLVRQAYCAAEWLGPSMGSLDPESDIAAAEKRVQLGVTTLSEETAQMTGGDWLQKHRQRVKEEKLRRKDGLSRPEGFEPTNAGGAPEDDAASIGDSAGDPPGARRQRLSPARDARRRALREREEEAA